MMDAHFEQGHGCTVERGSIVGYPYEGWDRPAVLGQRCHIRTGSIIYADTVIADDVVTGTTTCIREHTRIGSRCVIGTATIIEGQVEIADDVVLQSGVYIPTHAYIGNRAFLGPRVVLTNDRYPLRQRSSYQVAGPVIEDDASIGANATILPGVRVGEGAIVGAGAVVTRDVPSWTLALGVPARFTDLPPDLKHRHAKRAIT